jgi:hypothetical protein
MLLAAGDWPLAIGCSHVFLGMVFRNQQSEMVNASGGWLLASGYVYGRGHWLLAIGCSPFAHCSKVWHRSFWWSFAVGFSRRIRHNKSPSRTLVL